MKYCYHTTLLALALVLFFPLSLGAQEVEQGADEVEQFDRFGLEEPDQEALTTFLVGQTGHGALLGLQSCGLTSDCYDSERATATSVLIGSAAGLGASFLYSRQTDITLGRATAKNFGTVLGGATGLLTVIAIDDHFDDARTPIFAMMGGQFLGLTGGHYLGRHFHATAGDIFLMESGALWTTLLFSGTNFQILDRDPSSRGVALSYIGTLTLGSLGGAVLASQQPMTRDRVRLVDLGGALGGLLGFTAGRYSRGEDATPSQRSRAQWSGATIGAAAGLGTAFALTASFDDPDLFSDSSSSTSFGIAPADEDGGFQATLQGSF